jgi:hypothetical protein
MSGDEAQGSRRRSRDVGPREVAHIDPGAFDEEFLFHLSRGSEYLIANEVVQAKEELERALSFRPLDARSQDLLASVYFRLGVYPRAIEIWTSLVQSHGEDVALRVNLGLALLKTAQPELALGHLARAVAKDPSHERAWRYAGLAEWRVGNLDRAREAFLRGGQASMARRMEEMLGSSAGHTAGQEAAPYIESARLSLSPPGLTPAPDGEDDPRAEQVIAGLAAAPELHAVELARVDLPRPGRTLAPAPLPSLPLADLDPGAPARVSSPPGALTIDAAGNDAAGLGPTFALTHDGILVLRPWRPIFARKSSLRAIVGTLPTETVPRPGRQGGTDGVLGDQDPFHRFAGQRALHYALPRGPQSERFELLLIEGETFFVVERALFGFDEQLGFESGDLADAEGPSMRLLQLRGTGVCALRVERSPSKLVVRESDEVRVLVQGLVGWTGRLIPGASHREGAREVDERWISLRGEGVVYFT